MKKLVLLTLLLPSLTFAQNRFAQLGEELPHLTGIEMLQELQARLLSAKGRLFYSGSIG